MYSLSLFYMKQNLEKRPKSWLSNGELIEHTRRSSLELNWTHVLVFCIKRNDTDKRDLDRNEKLALLGQSIKKAKKETKTKTKISCLEDWQDSFTLSRVIDFDLFNSLHPTCWLKQRARAHTHTRSTEARLGGAASSTN